MPPAILIAVIATLLCLVPRPVRAFGESGVFDPRVLIVGTAKFDGLRSTAPARFSWELTRRTSAPARLAPEIVRADSHTLLSEPFAWWIGDKDPGELHPREIGMLRQFFALGGVLLVDESEPDKKDFTRGAKRELGRVIPDIAPIAIGTEHVVFRSFYLLRRAEGRVAGSPKLEAIVRNGATQVLFSSHDLAGALAQYPSGSPVFPVTPGGEPQREMAIRLSINVAMYVLCTNYKDDQVHAPFLMRRRARDF
ncbi:MAG: DUF4159 domain-containing protein [Deltaproteobacteria bacterium]|nr:DUF4159 domain-containing protein [Deltaproteobacteria bacterium]